MNEVWRKQPYAPYFETIEIMLRRIWCRETASPNCQKSWTPENPAYGQCAVTAASMYHGLGGPAVEGLRIMRAEVEGFGSHYWIRLPDGIDVDLTACQFPEGTVIPEGEERTVEYLLDSERAKSARTRERMELLDEIGETIVCETLEAMQRLGLDTET